MRSVKPSTRTRSDAAKRSRQPLARLLVAPGDADHGHVSEREQLVDRALEVADAPAPAGDDDHPACAGEAEGGARGSALARLEELGGDQRPHDLGGAASGDPLDVAHRRVVA